MQSFPSTMTKTSKRGSVLEYDFANGDRYAGYVSSNKMNGRGVYTWVDGSTLKALFKNSMASGSGKLVTAEGVQYTGSFKANMFHGPGELKLSQGVLRAEFENGRAVRGKIKLKNGDCFDIEECNKKENVYYGTYTWGTHKKDHYKGEIHGINGSAEGDGKYCWPNYSYEGQFQAGRRDGVGILRDKDNRIIFSGVWTQGKPELLNTDLLLTAARPIVDDIYESCE